MAVLPASSSAYSADRGLETSAVSPDNSPPCPRAAFPRSVQPESKTILTNHPRPSRSSHPRRPKPQLRAQRHKSLLQPPPLASSPASPPGMARHRRRPPPPLDAHLVREKRTHPLLPQPPQPRDRQARPSLQHLRLPVRQRRKPVSDRGAAVQREFRERDLLAG